MSYLTFTEVAAPKRKTALVQVFSARHGDLLGMIGWHGAWRQYVFESQPNVVWSHDCLADVQAKLTELNAARRAARATA